MIYINTLYTSMSFQVIPLFYKSKQMRYFPAILLPLIDFAVQVSDKPKGIAVGAAKECVHTLSRVFFSFLFF